MKKKSNNNNNNNSNNENSNNKHNSNFNYNSSSNNNSNNDDKKVKVNGGGYRKDQIVPSNPTCSTICPQMTSKRLPLTKRAASDLITIPSRGRRAPRNQRYSRAVRLDAPECLPVNSFRRKPCSRTAAVNRVQSV